MEIILIFPPPEGETKNDKVVLEFSERNKAALFMGILSVHEHVKEIRPGRTVISKRSLILQSEEQ